MKAEYISIALAALFAACTPVEDIRITTPGPEPVTLTCSGDAVLLRENNSSLALTLNWTSNNNIGTTGSAVAPKNATVNIVQFSAADNFETCYEYLTDKGSTSAQFTVEALNTIAVRLGMEGGVKAPLYVRVSSTLGTSFSVSSNTVSLYVTPYSVDLSIAHILNSSHEDTGATLKATSAGVYEGFMGVGGWYNWFLLESSGTEWGNLGQDGYPFYISTASDKWNMWFPGMAGCYYTIVDTKKAEWSALYIPSLSISGDISGEMTFDKGGNRWLYTWTASSAGEVNVTIGGSGKQYGVTTGTDDDAAADVTVGFGGSASAVTFGSSASSIAVSVEAAGEVTLVLDLTAMTLGFETGGVAPVAVPGKLYAVGVDDGWTGADWNFDNYLILYDEDNLSYAGGCNVNSLWGYRYYTEEGSWDNFYGWTEGDALAGKLELANSANIPAPETGMYLMTVSLKALEYANIPVTDVFIAGVGRDTGWELLAMDAGDVAGQYSLSLLVEDKTPWGFKIYINDWEHFFGGSDGNLVYNADGCPVDDSYIGTTCLFTVDLCKGTYSIEKQ